MGVKQHILGTHVDKLLLLEGRPTEITFSREERIEILDVGENLLKALEIKRNAMQSQADKQAQT